MTGKERVLAAIKCQEVDRVPWVPFVGCHAGALLGKTATEFLQNEDYIVQGVSKSIELYKPDGIPVIFDLQIEAEAFGCDLNWSDENPPAVCSHPLGNGTKLEDLKVPLPDEGRIQLSISAAKRLREKYPDIALYGLITGPFTLALHLLGTDIFMKMFDDTEFVNKLLDFCKETCKAMSKYYIDAGCDIVAVVDPMTSQIGPDQFKQFITPHAVEIFDYIRELGGLGSFFVCGHAQQNIEVMCQSKPDNISIDENIPLDFVKDISLRENVSFGGNMQLTTVLLLGKPEDAKKNALACLDIGGEKGFILAPGCDLPYATPKENLECIYKVVADEYEREVVRTMVGTQDAMDKMDMTEYGKSDKVIVDIVTLDSEACAPCQYMVDSVRKITPEFDGLVEWREHKIKYRESLVFMTSLMVRNIPTICIDGEIKFVSRIPPREELIAAIQKRINEKLRMKIKQKRATVQILGAKSDKRDQLEGRLEQSIKELGADIDLQVDDDKEHIESYGISSASTPAVVITKYQLKSAGFVPETAAIKEWLKEL